jgi:hypothetical protein
MTISNPIPTSETAALGGPRTEAGKFESSKNAISHGLTAATIDRFPEHIREAYAAFLAEQYEEHQPATTNERDFLEQYAFNRFQISRAQAMLSEAWEKVTLNPGDESLEKKYQKLVRHVRALERTAKYALNELRTFISDRLTNSELDNNMPPFVQRGVSIPVAFPAHRVLPPRPKPEELKNTVRAYIEELSTRFSVESICKPELLEAARRSEFAQKEAA